MLPKPNFYKYTLGFLTLMLILLAACTPTAIPGTGVDPTRPAATAAPTQPAPTETSGPNMPLLGLDANDILLQLTYEPGFTLPEFRYPFGRTPFFTLLADGRAIYIDENQDSKVMQAQLSQEEAATLHQQVLDMGFERLESHTDMCGMLADGSEPCIADVHLWMRKDGRGSRARTQLCNFKARSVRSITA